jgi:hypothetical protein
MALPRLLANDVENYIELLGATGVLFDLQKVAVDHRTAQGRSNEYRCDGRFYGRRVNCEYVPLLPASAVRLVLDGSAKDSVPAHLERRLGWPSQRGRAGNRLQRVAWIGLDWVDRGKAHGRDSHDDSHA